MKVSKLIKKLQTLDGNADVLLSIDEEGNGFSHADAVSEYKYLQYGNEIDLLDEEDIDKDTKVEKCIVIWP